MDWIFCAKFCEICGGWPACWKVWHAKCYGCLGLGKFPVKATTNEEGNLWSQKEKRAQRINHRV